MKPRLELRDLRTRFDSFEAVKGVNLSLRRGEFLSLLGPSGCGKSTTLSMIAGFLDPDGGEILVDGRVVNRLPPQRRRIGLVFQDYAVFSRLTVRENLAFGLEAQRVPRDERERRLSAMIEKLDLGPILGRYGGSLNMSEMQRVAIARVLVTQPELLLLDEPMSNLDASLRASLRGELKQIQRELNQTILYVTHDQVEAMSMSDRIAVMRAGELLQVGTPDEIYHRPVDRFVAEFIGDPPINILPCDVSVSGGGVSVRTALHGPIALTLHDVPQGRHWLGVRPHHFRLAEAGESGAAASIVRFVENLGAEHIIHVDYGDQLAAVATVPHAAAIGDRVAIAIEAGSAHLIREDTGRVAASVPVEPVA
ncbi:MAG: ABC transporter ATP-binding protein [Dongiaceae bacterium]